MSKKDLNNYNKFFQDNSNPSFWGIELIRDSLLKDVLSADIHDILYWAGKNLAIKYPIHTDDLPEFFQQSQFGTLELTTGSESKNVFTLTGAEVQARLSLDKDADFMLEAGFIAQTIQQNSGFETEAEYKIKRKNIVEITVISDISRQIINPDDVAKIELSK
ncbi:YslB family protein [Fructilactobacillus sp. Tb1]|uniref:YslB family protein n=1 Tax=Fructilactobacillus sp. Tb1 TaxID=3422304 RepID=UPI003D29A2E8